MRVSVLMYAAMVALCACSFSQPAPPKHTFLLTVTRPDNSPLAQAAGSATLKVLPFTVGSPYNGKSFIYREGEVQFTADYYNEWIASPVAMLTDRTTTLLAKSGVFAKVVPAASGLEGSVEMEAIVSELYADYRDKAKPQAVVAIQFHLSDATSGRLYYDQLLRATSALSEATPDGYARGVDAALARLYTKLESELRGTKIGS